METAQTTRLPDGRLHLHHGPIDIIASAEGAGRDDAYAAAAARFETVLTEIVRELPALRTAVSSGPTGHGTIARAMIRATAPFDEVFVTPMAAVAGAVADEILRHLAGPGIRKAHVNNGGDVAIYLGEGQQTAAAVAGPVPALVHIGFHDHVRGIATSGWRGRSHSLGIADSVTVLARSAATADVAATLIANAVDLPDHSGIMRQPAVTLWPDSDRGDRLVTTAVPVLSHRERQTALQAGHARAREYHRAGHIEAAYLVLQADTAQVGPMTLSIDSA